jgi:hypothetical protein
LAQLFQRSRLKYEKVNGRTTDAKWWQYLTWPFGSGELKNVIHSLESSQRLRLLNIHLVSSNFFTIFKIYFVYRKYNIRY